MENEPDLTTKLQVAFVEERSALQASLGKPVATLNGPPQALFVELEDGMMGPASEEGNEHPRVDLIPSTTTGIFTWVSIVSGFCGARAAAKLMVVIVFDCIAAGVGDVVGESARQAFNDIAKKAAKTDCPSDDEKDCDSEYEGPAKKICSKREQILRDADAEFIDDDPQPHQYTADAEFIDDDPQSHQYTADEMAICRTDPIALQQPCISASEWSKDDQQRIRQCLSKLIPKRKRGQARVPVVTDTDIDQLGVSPETWIAIEATKHEIPDLVRMHQEETTDELLSPNLVKFLIVWLLATLQVCSPYDPESKHCWTKLDEKWRLMLLTMKKLGVQCSTGFERCLQSPHKPNALQSLENVLNETSASGDLSRLLEHLKKHCPAGGEQRFSPEMRLRNFPFFVEHPSWIHSMRELVVLEVFGAAVMKDPKTGDPVWHFEDTAMEAMESIAQPLSRKDIAEHQGKLHDYDVGQDGDVIMVSQLQCTFCLGWTDKDGPNVVDKATYAKHVVDPTLTHTCRSCAQNFIDLVSDDDSFSDKECESDDTIGSSEEQD